MRLGVAENKCPTCVLKRARDDFRCTCRVAVDENDQRLAVGKCRLIGECRQHVEVPRLANLHNGAGAGIRAHEKRGEKHGLLERTASIATQVEDQAFNPLRVELRDPFRDVERAGAVAGVIRLSVHRTVECRKLDVPHLARDSVKRHRLDAACGGLVLELDLVTNDRHLPARGAVLVSDFKNDLGVLLAADLLDRLAHRLPDDVFNGIVSLTDADNLVAFLDRALARHRAALHDLLDLKRTIVHGLGEHSADTAKG